MNNQVISIRSFIGAKNYGVSKSFYQTLGWTINEIDNSMCYIQIVENKGFYLQRAYVKQWINNTMLFLEIENVEAYLEKIKALNLEDQFKGVRLSDIVIQEWGKEFFLHDPSGVLWHFGCFHDTKSKLL